MGSRGGNKVIYKDLSYRVVGVLYEAYNNLGYGHEEKWYEKAIAALFDELGISYREQAPYKIAIKGRIMGRKYIDFIVENKIVLELKQGTRFTRQNIEQIKGYLAVTGMRLAILAHSTPTGVKIFRAFNPNYLNATTT